MAKFRKIPVDVFRFGIDEPPPWFADANAKGVVEGTSDTTFIETREAQ